MVPIRAALEAAWRYFARARPATPQARCRTGQTIRVDGGVRMMD